MTRLYGLFLFVLALFGAPALAEPIDPDADVLGLYFDIEATEVCTSLDPFTPFEAWIILTRPTHEVLLGVEFGIDIAGGEVLQLTQYYNGNSMMWPQPLDNVIAGWVTPLMLEEATWLIRVQFLYVDTTFAPTTFTIHGSNPSSLPGDRPVYLTSDELLVPCRTPGAPGEVSAQINGDCGVVSTRTTTWSALKSLYRP